MAVKLRLKRFGRRHKPHFRLCAMDVREPRDGKALEELGAYTPLNNKDNTVENLNVDRVKHWLSVGAIPSETVSSLLKKAGIDVPERRQKNTSKPKPKKTAEQAKPAEAAE